MENGVPTYAYDYETAKITSGNMEICRMACLFVRLRNSTMKVQWKPFQSLLMIAMFDSKTRTALIQVIENIKKNVV